MVEFPGVPSVHDEGTGVSHGQVQASVEEVTAEVAGAYVDVREVKEADLIPRDVIRELDVHVGPVRGDGILPPGVPARLGWGTGLFNRY